MLSDYFKTIETELFCVNNKPGKQYVFRSILDIWTAECKKFSGTYKDPCQIHQDCNSEGDSCCLATKTGVRSKKLCGPTTVIEPKTLSKEEAGANENFVFKCPGYVSPSA